MSQNTLPQFSKIDLVSYVDTLDALLKSHLKQIDGLLEQKHFGWQTLMQAMEDMDNELERFWSPLSHLHAVVNSPALRECYQACLPKLSAYESAIGQNQALYQAIQSIDLSTLTATQQKIIKDALLNFELSGVGLSSEKKARFEALQMRLAELSNQFENNVLDASQAFSVHIKDKAKLQGLPAHALNTAKETAAAQDKKGWLLNLEFPCYQAVVTYADDRKLRETFYEAFVTRASDVGPNAGEFDNSSIMQEILSLRLEEAQLLGFQNFAELSLAKKMAKSTDEVLAFLMDLSQKSYAQAQADINKLEDFAKQAYDIDKLEPWDIAYLSEKLCKKEHSLSQEELRPYFPENKVMEGLFTIVERLYGISIEAVQNFESWHPDVRCYQLKDAQGHLRGHVYVDLYARQQKRGGAWMDSLQGRKRNADGSLQLPIATLTCNFAKPSANATATFSHDEVLTLFHEFGHCLHHLLSKVDYLSASGINGVEWDAVELPSQFFENWCWEQSVMPLLAEHVDSKAPLPLVLFERLEAAKNFQSAMAMMRQLEFSLFDFRIHQSYNKADPNCIDKLLQEVRKETTVVPIVHYNRFQHSFSHIFAGGYAAGYYSYKWAEVLSSDAFERFEEEGVFNEQTGQDFLEKILEIGSSKTAAEAFQAFRGRPAKTDALLRHNGIQIRERENEPKIDA